MVFAAASFSDVWKAILLGLIEGITEWLPISSTGHMILADSFLSLGVSEGFRELFFVVIQLFAVLAVPTLYGKKLFLLLFADPAGKNGAAHASGGRFTFAKAVLVASLPAAVLGALLDGAIDRLLFRPAVVGATLVIYGVAFLLVERLREGREARVRTTSALSVKDALGIGAFQALSLVPGTSRSGATILGGLLLGVSRGAATEFSFFLALPIMLGASGLKIAKYVFSGGGATGREWGLLVVGSLCAYFVSLAAIRALTAFVARRSFRAFGVYRILLGAAVLARCFL